MIQSRNLMYSVTQPTHLFVNCRDVSLQIPGCLEAVVAQVTNEVVAFVDAPDMVVQVWTPLKLFAASIASEWHLFLVNQLDVVLHS